jgi:hypothetical protein
MSPFSISRELSNKVAKRSITLLGDIYKNAAAPTVSAYSVSGSISAVSINGVVIDQQLSTNISLANVTAGVATPGKYLVTNSNTSITGIGILSVQSLYLGGVAYSPSQQGGSVQSVDDSSSTYLTANVLIPGTAVAEKAIVLNSNLSIGGINNLDMRVLKLNNVMVYFRNSPLPSNTYGEMSVHYRPEIKESYESLLTTPHLCSTYSNSASILPYTSPFNKVIYSQELDRYVALGTGSYSSMYWSRNGYKWYPGNLQTSGPINNINSTFLSWICVEYAPELQLFVAYSQAGTNYLFWRSVDGINWSYVRTLAFSSMTYYGICWNPDRMEFLAVAQYNSAVSSDGITWTSVGATGQWSVSGNSGPCCIYHRPSKTYILATNSTVDYSHLRKSVDGRHWVEVPTVPGNASGTTFSLVYAPELDIIVAGTNQGGSHPNKFYMYSKDGGNTWMYSTCANNSVMNRSHWITWVSKLRMFLSGNESSAVGYSFDGMVWHYANFGAMGNLSSFWNYKTSSLVSKATTTGAGWSNHALGHMTGTMSSIACSTSGTSITLGGAMDTNASMCIYGKGTSGNAIKFRHSSDSVVTSLQVANNVMRISSNIISFTGTMQISGVPIDDIALKIVDDVVCDLNPFGTLITSNSIPGKIAVFDSSNNLSVQNVLHVGSLTASNYSSVTGANHLLLTNTTAGVASSGKILTHRNGAVSVSSLGVKEIRTSNIVVTGGSTASSFTMEAMESYNNMMDFSKIGLCTTPSSTTLATSYVLSSGSTAFTNKMNPYFVPGVNKMLFFDTAAANLWTSVSGDFGTLASLTQTSACWMPTSTGITNVKYIPAFQRLYLMGAGLLLYTTDMITLKQCHLPSGVNTKTFRGLAYSPELKMFVAHVGLYGFISSRDGLNWVKHSDANYLSTIDTSNAVEIEWIPWASMFVAVLSVTTHTRPVWYSVDGIKWSNKANLDGCIFTTSTGAISMAVSERKQIIVATLSNNIIYSLDGRNWAMAYLYNAYNSISNVVWVDDYDCFMYSVTNTSAVPYLVTSKTGRHWNDYVGIPNPSPSASASFGSRIAYNQFARSITICNDTTAAAPIAIDATVLQARNFAWNDTLLDTGGLYFTDNVNARFGIGIQPQYTLHLSRDAAYKPTSTTWTTTSDERLKEDIQPADIAQCYDVVKAIPLKHYRWKDSTYSDSEINDRSQLGWIAQDVQPYIPSSITASRFEGQETLSLNNDQLIANMYGAIQYLQQMDEALEEYFE